MEQQYNPSNITVPQMSEPQYYNQQQFAQDQTQYNYQQPNQLTVPNQPLTGVQPAYAATNNTTVIVNKSNDVMETAAEVACCCLCWTSVCRMFCCCLDCFLHLI
ncbi:Hypothetical_protein [Hexamita inflata]|uniref:Hypothetical_protein n=1 Tax=Hexamita inflata TaxID=28002 RepID=A0ABP1HQ47_9EUKA